MAAKKRRRRRQTGFLIRRGRVQWLNLLMLVALMGGLGWFVAHGWNDQPQTITTSSSHTTFIKKIATEAQNLQGQYHVLPSITISQAILESDWGQSTNATENNNLFGVKAAGTQAGRLMTTQEYYDGDYHTVKRRFRVYDSWDASLLEHAKTLANGTTWNPQQYAEVTQASDYQTAAQALQKAGYATDPSYAQKLINIIQKYDLQRYDSKY